MIGRHRGRRRGLGGLSVWLVNHRQLRQSREGSLGCGPGRGLSRTKSRAWVSEAVEASDNASKSPIESNAVRARNAFAHAGHRGDTLNQFEASGESEVLDNARGERFGDSDDKALVIEKKRNESVALSHRNRGLFESERRW